MNDKTPRGVPLAEGQGGGDTNAQVWFLLQALRKGDGGDYGCTLLLWQNLAPFGMFSLGPCSGLAWDNISNVVTPCAQSCPLVNLNLR